MTDAQQDFVLGDWPMPVPMLAPAAPRVDIDALERSFAIRHAVFLIETTALQVADTVPPRFDSHRLTTDNDLYCDAPNQHLDALRDAVAYLDAMGLLLHHGSGVVSIRSVA